MAVPSVLQHTYLLPRILQQMRHMICGRPRSLLEQPRAFCGRAAGCCVWVPGSLPLHHTPCTFSLLTFFSALHISLNPKRGILPVFTQTLSLELFRASLIPPKCCAEALQLLGTFGCSRNLHCPTAGSGLEKALSLGTSQSPAVGALPNNQKA